MLRRERSKLSSRISGNWQCTGGGGSKGRGKKKEGLISPIESDKSARFAPDQRKYRHGVSQ